MASLAPYSQPLNPRLAGHLMRRVTLGPSQSEIQFATGQTPGQILANVLVTDAPINPPVDPATGSSWVNPSPGPGNSMDDDLRGHFMAWWMGNVHRHPTTIYERMVWFWHNHFPTISSRVTNSAAIWYQHQLFRKYALGNYKTLTRAICVDNAMLAHLDGKLNVAASPQENFAREFFELFTVGKGAQVSPTDYTTFSENDVKEATRLLTGWDIDHTFSTVDAVTGIPRGKLKGNGQVATQHDAGTKNFGPAFNNTSITPAGNSKADAEAELDAFIDMVFQSSHTAKYLCRKLYRFFVYYDITPEIEQDIIEPLAQQLMQANYEIVPVLQTLLSSEHFYDVDDQISTNDNVGAIIKSPLEITVGTLRSLEVPMPSESVDLNAFYRAYGNSLVGLMDGQGLQLHEPYDVAGYDPFFQFPSFNRLWITPNYLAMRYKYGETILTGVADMMGNLLFKLEPEQWISTYCSNPSDPDQLVLEVCSFLVPIDLDQTRRQEFRDQGLLDGITGAVWSTEWNSFAQGGTSTTVNTQLEKLFRRILQSPEYQIY